jgi:hypothetical protein
MHSLGKHKEQKLGGNRSPSSTLRESTTGVRLSLLVVVALCMLSSCGGNANPPQADPQVSGNWQFNLSTSGTSFVSSPLQGGFLVEKNGSITGQIVFALYTSAPGQGVAPCNGGTATVTGTISGQSVNLTAVVGTVDQYGNATTQTFTLSGGTLSPDGSTIGGNDKYTVTAGYGTANKIFGPCGESTDTGTWSASLVPPLTGSFQGFFHSADSSNISFMNQNFPVSGSFTQGPNTGAATATVTGTLLFEGPVTLLNDYPCLTTAQVNGTISGTNVLLQIFNTSGNPVGQIGQTPAASGSSNQYLTAVTLDSTPTGYVLRNDIGLPTGQTQGGGYELSTGSCPSPGGPTPGDFGNLCLALNGSTACNQPIIFTPFSLTFAPQLVGSAATSQTVTLTNNTSSPLSALGATLNLMENDSVAGASLFYPKGGNFNGVSNFTEQDNCTQQGSISLAAGASCTITIFFSPQESCPWLPQPQGGVPGIDGLAPASCPITLTATVNVTLQTAPSGSDDLDTTFSFPVSGSGLSAVVPSVPEIDFGWETLGEAGPPHSVTFTNQSPNPVYILPPMSCVYSPSTAAPVEPRPPMQNGQPSVSGITMAATQVATSKTGGLTSSIGNVQTVSPPTVAYYCDSDPPVPVGSGQSNFQISNDTCSIPGSGVTLAPFGQAGDSCSLEITFVPQPATFAFAGNILSGIAGGWNDFLQLNTAWCGDANNPPETNCEVDSGRFPVEIKTEPPSPLRFSPSAGMDFGTVLRTTASNPLTVTIFNDPVDPNAQPVTFAGKLVTGGDYLETDTCPGTLPSDQSCTVTVTFTPTKVGLDPGNITFTSIFTVNGITLIRPQTIYFRGTGQ